MTREELAFEALANLLPKACWEDQWVPQPAKDLLKSLSDAGIKCGLAQSPQYGAIVVKLDGLTPVIAWLEVDALPGPTGEFPQGQIHPADEGELRLTVALAANGKIIVDFGKPVTWLGFGPTEAEELAQSLLSMAADARRIGGQDG